MRLECAILIHRPPQDVWGFLAEPSHLPRWDQGVAGIETPEPTTPAGVGFEFTTVGHAGSAPDRGRMTYRIAETDPLKGCRVELTSSTGNARFFKNAQWHFRVYDASQGSRVVCSADFRLRLRYLLLAPILYAMKGAIRRDLVSLKRALENV